MRIGSLFFSYLLQQYFKIFIGLFFLFIFIFGIFDAVEVFRRLAGNIDVIDFFMMVITHSAYIVESSIDFFAFFTAVLMFYRLSHTQELIIIRSVGLSVWHFLVPVCFGAFILGVGYITILNPVFSYMKQSYDRLYNRYIEGEDVDHIALTQGGIWIRETWGADSRALGFDGGGRQEVFESSGAFIHIQHTSLGPDNIELFQNVSLLFLDRQGRFLSRAEAASARILPGLWVFSNAHIYDHSGAVHSLVRINFPAKVTLDKIRSSFVEAQNVSFWRLYSFARNIENTGFSSRAYWYQYAYLLALPFRFTIGIFLAAAIALFFGRQIKTVFIFTLSIFIGLVLFMAENILGAFVREGVLSISVGLLATPLVSLAAALVAVSLREDR